MLETRLQAGQWLCGAQQTLADLAIFPFVRQFALVDRQAFEQLPLPAVQRWLQYWLQSRQFAAVMHNYSPWQAGQQGERFPPVGFSSA
jgi:glutathione S-transferase